MMTFLLCRAPPMYFDKQGSDLLCRVAAASLHTALSSCYETFSPSPQITSSWLDVMFHTMPLNLCKPQAKKMRLSPPRLLRTRHCLALNGGRVSMFPFKQQMWRRQIVHEIIFFLRRMFSRAEPKRRLPSRRRLSNIGFSLSHRVGVRGPASAPAARRKAFPRRKNKKKSVSVPPPLTVHRLRQSARWGDAERYAGKVRGSEEASSECEQRETGSITGASTLGRHSEGRDVAAGLQN